jgi:ABC-type phosphate transport system substrate-binding protein
MSTTRRIGLLVAVLALVVAACGGDTADDTTTTTAAGTTTTTPTMADETDELTGLPVIDPLDVPDGSVAIAGSSTVFPLSTAIMSLWEDEGGPGYAIDSIGSGGGFERFCVDGASDISNASRPIKEEEVASCSEIGRDPIEIRVGTDALSLVVSQSNYFVDDLTFEEIAAAFSLTSPDATWARPATTRGPSTTSTRRSSRRPRRHRFSPRSPRSWVRTTTSPSRVSRRTGAPRETSARPAQSDTSDTPTTPRTPTSSRPSPSRVWRRAMSR